MSVIAENGAHVNDHKYAEAVLKNGCPYKYKCRITCCLYELHHYGYNFLSPPERLTCKEAATVFLGGKAGRHE